MIPKFICLIKQKKNSADSVFFNNDLFDFYKKIIRIRNNYEVLQLGEFNVLAISDELGIYVYERKYGKQKIIVALNKGKKKELVSLNINHKGFLKDLLNSNRKVRAAGGMIVFSIRPKEGRILLVDDSK